MTRRDYEYYDHLIAMDRSNLRSMQRVCGQRPSGKGESLLMDQNARPGDVSDPTSTGDLMPPGGMLPGARRCWKRTKYNA